MCTLWKTERCDGHEVNINIWKHQPTRAFCIVSKTLCWRTNYHSVARHSEDSSNSVFSHITTLLRWLNLIESFFPSKKPLDSSNKMHIRYKIQTYCSQLTPNHETRSVFLGSFYNSLWSRMSDCPIRLTSVGDIKFQSYASMHVKDNL